MIDMLILSCILNPIIGLICIIDMLITMDNESWMLIIALLLRSIIRFFNSFLFREVWIFIATQFECHKCYRICCSTNLNIPFFIFQEWKHHHIYTFPLNFPCSRYEHQSSLVIYSFFCSTLVNFFSSRCQRIQNSLTLFSIIIFLNEA